MFMHHSRTDFISWSDKVFTVVVSVNCLFCLIFLFFFDVSFFLFFIFIMVCILGEFPLLHFLHPLHILSVNIIFLSSEPFFSIVEFMNPLFFFPFAFSWACSSHRFPSSNLFICIVGGLQSPQKFFPYDNLVFPLADVSYFFIWVFTSSLCST